MTTILLSAKRLEDGRIVLTNRKGEELPMQVVPVEVARDMALAGRRACCAVADRMEAARDMAVSTLDFWQQVGHEPANGIYEAMLSAASVDVSEAVVEIPESLHSLESNFVEHRHPQYGLGAFCTPDVYDALDALTPQSGGKGKAE